MPLIKGSRDNSYTLECREDIKYHLNHYSERLMFEKIYRFSDTNMRSSVFRQDLVARYEEMVERIGVDWS